MTVSTASFKVMINEDPVYVHYAAIFLIFDSDKIRLGRL